MASVDELRPFLEDPAVIERWRNLISATTLDSGCRIWTGAISSKGHGRFWVGQRTDGRDLVMIAHRFGYAITYGLDALLAADVIRHLCDEPSCQTPTHWAAGTAAENTTDWWQRHHTPGPPKPSAKPPSPAPTSKQPPTPDSPSATDSNPPSGENLVSKRWDKHPGLSSCHEH